MRRLVIVVLLGTFAAACGEAADEGSTATTPAVSTTVVDPTTTVTVSPTSTTTAAAEEHLVCDQPLGAGFSQLECDGMVFDVALPETCLSGACGVIVDVHPKGMTSADEERGTGMQGLGNAAGYVVIQPQSPGLAWDLAVDSVRIRSFLDQLIGGLDIDRNRVHIGGASQGGKMTWLFVCEHADLIASAAPFAAGATTESDPSCDFDVAGSSSQQVDILLVHGWNDSIAPFDSALARRDVVIAAWEMTESEVLANEPTHRWTRWISPQGTVFELLEYDGGHCFPGVHGPVHGCSEDDPVHYGQAALDFYIAHPKDQ